MWAVAAAASVTLGIVAIWIELVLRSYLFDVQEDPDRPVHDGAADGAFFFGGAVLLLLAGLGAAAALAGLSGTSPPSTRRAVRAVATVGMLLAASVVALFFVPLGWGPT